MFCLKIETGNAAFKNPFTGEDDIEYESAELMSLLDEVKNELDDGKTSGNVIDANGNMVGSWGR